MLTSKAQAARLAQLFKQGRRLEYGKGEFIVRPGETPPGVFYIEKGLVKCYDITRYGEENLLTLRKEHEILGLTWVVTAQKHDIIYTALAPTVLWLLPGDKFLAQVEKKPEYGLALIGLLTEMYRLHSEHILNLEYRSVRERLIAFLLATRWRFGKESNNTVVIEAPLRHQDIASYINASRETTSRELNGLARKGLIEVEQGLITLKDIDQLRRYLEP